LVELGIESVGSGTVDQVGLIHVNNQPGVMELHETLKEAMDLPEEAILTEFTPGLSVHTGSGVIAFGLVTK
jgi:fatty acid-binding protein DegV